VADVNDGKQSKLAELVRGSSLRGAAPVPLSAALCTRVGRALGTLARQRLGAGRKRIVVGRSHDGAQLGVRDGLVRGLVLAGHDVFDVGCVTSEIFTFALKDQNGDAGVLVTSTEGAMHNLVFFLGGRPLVGDALHALCAIGDGEDFSAGAGTLAVVDVRAAYAKSARTQSPDGDAA
jgi:phosphomannomutase